MRHLLRRWVERHPLAWVALTVLGAVLSADGSHALGLTLAAAALVVIGASRLWRVAAIAIALSLVAGELHFRRDLEQCRRIASVERSDSSIRSLTGTVLFGASESGRGWSALVELQPAGGKVWWRGLGPVPREGDTIRASGNLLPFPRPRNPGEFDVAGWLYRQGAWGVFEASGVAELVAPAPAWKRTGLSMRERFREAVTAGMDPHGRQAMVVRAMVLGEHPDDDVLVDAFRRSGTLHVFCVSGLHVGMVGLLVWGALRLCQVPRCWAVPIIFAAMLAYAWMTGMKPPALRAVVMAGVLLAGFLLKRRPDVLNALGLAFVAAVLADGHVVFQPGARLSFGVVAAIGLLAERATPWFSWMTRTESYLPRQLYGPWRSLWLGIRRRTADSLGVSVAAGIGSLPLAAWHFGILSPVSIVASSIICPLVFWLLAVALLAAAASPIPGAPTVVNRLNGGLANACMWVAKAGCAVPGGHHLISRGRPGSDFLMVYDVGYGGGAACLHEEGTTVLFDTGHRPGFRRLVMPSLRTMALQPESMVLSHPDSGHLGGAAEACDAFPVRRILWPVERAKSPVFRHLEQTAANRGIPLVLGEPGRNYRISSDSWLEVVHAPDPMDWHAIADERVMIVRLHWNGWRILFTGDAGWNTERAMLESGRDLSADVIVMSRHAQDGSGGDDFLAAVAPRAIVAGHADFPAGERVPDDWRWACERRGIRVFHQGECGGVTMAARPDGSLDLHGFLGDLRLVLTR